MTKTATFEQQLKAAQVVDALQSCRDAGLNYWWCAKHDCEGLAYLEGIYERGYCEESGQRLLAYRG